MRSATVAEAPFRLEVNGTAVATWTCSPGQIEALATGWLLVHGFLAAGDAAPPVAVREEEGVLVAAAVLPGAAARAGMAEATHRREAGCGALHAVRCVAPPAAHRPPPPGSAAPFPALFRALFETGGAGLHSAALSDGASLLTRAEEVGRHNAVDKVIGQALIEGRPLAPLGLVLSSRISGEIAAKAVRAGVAWVASRSVPTTLAVRIAATAGLPLIARAPSREAVLFDPAMGPRAYGGAE
jgi:FdhD protein